MSRRATGTVFISIAAFLVGVRYISSAIYGSGLFNGSKEQFELLQQTLGGELKSLGWLAFVFGVIYLVWGEFEGLIQKLIQIVKSKWKE